ncbi:hypothetical protein HK096_007750, partial [Nowakowskiella sp. JEL0078]
PVLTRSLSHSSKITLPLEHSKVIKSSTRKSKRKSNKYEAEIRHMVSDFLKMLGPHPDIPEHESNKEWSLIASIPAPAIKVYKLMGSVNCFKVIADIRATPETAFDLLSGASECSNFLFPVPIFF